NSFDEASAIQSRNQLDDLLRPIKGFDEFLADREASRQRELVRQFAILGAKAEQGVYFINEYLRRHLGDPHTEALIGLKANLERSVKPSSIDDTSIDGVIRANDGLDGFVARNGLSGEYDRIIVAYLKAPESPAPPPTI